MSVRSWARGSLRVEAGQWILRIRIDGTERRLHVGASKLGKAAARAAADDKLAELGLIARDGGESVTLAAYSTFFLDDVCARKKPSTVAGYASAFRQHLLPALGRRRLTEIGPRDFTSLVAHLEAAGKKPRTVRLVVTVLARALKAAIDNGYAARVPDLSHLALSSVRIVEAPMRCFTVEETSRILAAADYPWRAFYAVLAYAGLRCGEALALRWRHIDFAAGQIVIDQAACMGAVQATKSQGSEARLHMPAALVRELAAYRVDPLVSLDALLFPSPRRPDQPLWSSGVRRSHFAPLLKRLGIAPAGFHAFRHSFATELFALGTPATVVKQMLRHADMKTTLRYTHVTLEDQRRASEAFGKALTGAAA